MDTKTLFSALSVAIGVIAFIPYIKDALVSKTQPHQFTWLIFAIVQGTSAAIIWQNGGMKGSLILIVGAFLTIIVFLISLFNGKWDIAKIDIAVLAIALSAIIIWLFLDNPLLAVFVLTSIDLIGHIPTFRKSYSKPYTENISLWGAFAVADLLAILALESYTVLTLTYLTAITAMNIAVTTFLIIRRYQISNHNNE